MMQRWLPSMVFLFLALLSGCTAMEKAYEGEELPKEGIGRVSTPIIFTFFYNSTVYIHKVDNKNMGLFVTEAELLPGTHSFTVKWSEFAASGAGSASDWGFIDLNVKAGRSYQIDMNHDFIWAVDQKTGEVVAGVKPP